jgi:glycosyltransferase involved in cell wall biosynthesis
MSIRVHRPPGLDAVIVIDDSKSAEDLSSEFADLGLRHVRLSERVFQSRARNVGWEAGVSEFVYFIDDDNVVLDGTLRGPFELLVANPNLGAVMPAVLYKARPEIVWVYATPLDLRRWGHTLIGRNRPRVPELEGRLLPTDALPNAFIVRREALEQLGGFDEAFVMSGSADFALRLKKAGWDVRAYTGAFTLHDVEPPGRVGYWASHRGIDPERVFHDVRDWFKLMRSLHPRERWFIVRATLHALGFMLPNALSYLLRGGPRGRESLAQLVRGYLSSLRALARG